MNTIKLLDCTLRDGGYVNHWRFGEKAISGILKKLVLSNVDLIECGYLSQSKGGDPDVAQFASLADLSKRLPEKRPGQRYAVMINFGEYDIDAIPTAVDDSPVLRVCFHKKDLDAAVAYCGRLVDKGHTVFLQPMAILNYSDGEFTELVHKANGIRVACFYIVDSFGVMETDDLLRLLLLADHNLASDIALGYHSHNNLQQAYGNAKLFVDRHMARDIVVDASVFGIGRGAGNLNMELFAGFLNKCHGKSYEIAPLLDIMDEHLLPIFREHFWGYSLPFYFSAQNNCHPNYALYFSRKNTLSNKSLNQLLASLPDDVKAVYSEELAEQNYRRFQERHVDDGEAVRGLVRRLEGRNVLILAPGKSLQTCRKAISDYIGEHAPVAFAINTAPPDYPCDFLFCSNEKRLRGLSLPPGCTLVATSNLHPDLPDSVIVDYASYLGRTDLIADNPTLMLLRLFALNGISRVAIAGFDGYSPVPSDNYFDPSLSLGSSIGTKLKKNESIRQVMEQMSQTMDIRFLTPSFYRSTP